MMNEMAYDRNAKVEVHRGRRLCMSLVLLAACFWPCVARAAQPSLKDISRSFDHSISQKPNMGKMVMILLGAGGIIVLLVVAAHWGQRRETPKILNHSGRLVREMRRKLHLSNPQIKRLKILAERRGGTNPLTVLLCPSLLGSKGDEATKRRSDGVTQG